MRDGALVANEGDLVFQPVDRFDAFLGRVVPGFRFPHVELPHQLRQIVAGVRAIVIAFQLVEQGGILPANQEFWNKSYCWKNARALCIPGNL